MKTKTYLMGVLALCFITSAAIGQAQVPLPGLLIPQFVDPLPMLDLTASGTVGLDTLVAGPAEIDLHMREFQVKVMPSTFVPATGTYTGTWVFGYVNGPTAPTGPRASYIGPVIIATRNAPTQVRYVNNLGNTATTNVSLWQSTVNGATDQTLHWADPLNNSANMCHHMIVPGQTPTMGCNLHYVGSIPAVPHLHGGEVPPVMDGDPDQWFTSDGLIHGFSYYTDPLVPVAGNEAVFRYPNAQEAAPLWFHDHLMGGTRINVYCGLAGAYMITDPTLVLPIGLTATGLRQGAAGPVDPLIPLVLQDRMFDVNGQLYFPNVGINPEHPYWIPEFVGDTIVVNGKVWPYVNVQGRRYRFLIINGSNARTYELSVTNQLSAMPGPAIWQIGTDGGYLDTPVSVSKLLIMPGERADIIIDFKGYEGQAMLLTNTAPTPYPGGDCANPATTGSIVLFNVQPGVVAADTSYNPATMQSQLFGKLRPPMTRLANRLTASLATGVVPQKTRQLTLNEVVRDLPITVNGVIYPGGPLEILVNNTTYEGKQGGTTVRPDFTPLTINGMTEYVSEVPNEGDTEVWEIVNLTMDAHPIHTHLTQFQLMNRQHFDTMQYSLIYAAAFPGGVFTPEFGPPLNYNTGNPRALGGNPDVVPFLVGPVIPPLPNEAGWKDTVMVRPGMVTRFVVRYAPENKPINSTTLNYPFDPFALGRNYVWHCHIIDHEDNEMMRPYAVTPKAGVVRTIVQGVDY